MLQYRHLNNFTFLLFFIFLLAQSSPVSAQTVLDSLKSEINKKKRDTAKAILEMEISRELHRRAHNKKQEYDYAEMAVQRALNSNDSLLYARALDNLGLLYRYHQYYNEALSLHIKAFKLIEDKNVPPLYKMIFANNAGVAGRYGQNYDTAISYYMKALRIAEKENDLKNIAISGNGIGNTLANIPGREDEALAYFKRSLKAEKTRGNSLGVAMNYLSIADYFIVKRKFGKAREYLEELLEINKKRNDLYGLSITNEFLGKSYLEEGEDLQKASSYFKTALEGFQELKDQHKQAELLIRLGDIHEEQNRPGSALTNYQRSLALGEELDQKALIMESSLKIAEVLEKQRDYAGALRSYKKGKAYEDSISLAEQNVEIAALVRKYDLEKKENHIQLLQKDKALQETLLKNQEQELKRRQLLLILLGAGFIFILIILLLQYRNYKTKRRTNASILKKEKEKMKAIYERNLARAEILVTRLRINPHFLFNSLNAITFLIRNKENSRAVKYLVVFSRYTRMVLETSQKHVVPLSEEIKLINYYLTLEKNRFEKGFSFEINEDESPELHNINIPPLLLQPFIENAIWHGLLPSKKDEKLLVIQLRAFKDGVEIIIDDNGVGRKNSQMRNKSRSHKSMGMDITQERIDLYNKSYSSKIEYHIVDKKDHKEQTEGTRIVLRILESRRSDTIHQVLEGEMT